MYGLFNRGEVFLISPGKTIGEQYKIVGIAQAETIRHKSELLTFKTEPSGVWDKRGVPHTKSCLRVVRNSLVRTPGHTTMEVVIRPLLIRTLAVRITKHEIIGIFQQSAVTG